MAPRVPDPFEDLTARQLLQVYNNEPTSERNKPMLLRKLRDAKYALLNQRPVVKTGAGAWNAETESLEFPVVESNRHHPRAVRLCTSNNDETAFWVNFVMACSAGAKKTPKKQDGARSKEYGTLPNAVHNLTALRAFYEPMRVGDPSIIIPGSAWRSAGYFAHTMLLSDPDRDAIDLAFDSTCHWLNVNAADPEFDSFQINLFFCGHGGAGNAEGEPAARDNSYIVLADGEMPITAYVDKLLDRFVETKVQASFCRINLFLDCCFSSAIARDFIVTLRRRQSERKQELLIGNIFCGSIHCSSLGDEKSFDHSKLDYSCFVSAYLRENSAAAIASQHPTMSAVSDWTDHRQHPVLLRNENGGMRLRFPTLYRFDAALKAGQPWNLDDVALFKAYPAWFLQGRPVTGNIDLEYMDAVMLRAQLMREFCKLNWEKRTTKPEIEYADRTVHWDNRPHE